MRVLPVLDLLGGRVVRGIAGERSRYEPIQSALVEGSDPISVAQALRDEFGFETFYVADLDSILGVGRSTEALASLTGEGLRLLVDAGVRQLPDALRLRERVECDVVAGLETLEGPDELARLVGALGPESVVLSIDLRAGVPISRGDAWPDDVDRIDALAVDLGVRRRILLDLAAVGVGAGVPHLARVRAWKERRPGCELVTGGGVRGIDDLRALRSAGADAGLVASALHDGRLGRTDLEAFVGDEVS